MDETSLDILKILQEKARIPNVEVSRQVGLAPSAVLERIRKMEKQGIIDGYEVRLNPERFSSSLIAFIHVTVKPTNLEQVGQDLASRNEVQEVHFVSGSDCLLVKLRCEDSPALGRFLQEQVQPMPGVVSTKTETVLQTIKETSRIPLNLAHNQ
jgi:Lrp/AsnC family leucine-responsive transcriptional regulator